LFTFLKGRFVVLPGFIAIKEGMTHVFDESTGEASPVTVLKVLPPVVTQVKSKESDGYSAIQLGAIAVKSKHLSKPLQGHFTSKGLSLLRLLKEFRVSEADLASFSVGATLPLEGLAQQKMLTLSSVSKGKGTMGSIRRWGQHRGPMSHGSKSHRIPGSIGAGTTPGRVLRGHHMAGRMGNTLTTISGMKVVTFFPEKSLLVVKGSVAGPNGCVVFGAL
jgi:large subunit ribosomal protein L3